MKEKTTEDIEREIRSMKEQLKDLNELEGMETEKGKVQKQLNKAKFRHKHKNVLKYTSGLEKGVLGLFRKLGKGIKKTGEGLAKSDDFINKQKAKERELLKNQPKKKTSKEEVDDELNFLD